MDEPIKVIFLDFDGVINGCGLIVGLGTKILPYKIFRFIERKILHTEMYGVHKSKVKRLAKICKKTGAKVVLTSSWRESVFSFYNNFTEEDLSTNWDHNSKKLAYFFKKYNIEVLGCTDRIEFRGKEICHWLMNYEGRINSFLILDDEYSHLPKMEVHTVFTTTNTPEKKIQGHWYCVDGLRPKHVREAIRRLNGIYYQDTCRRFITYYKIYCDHIDKVMQKGYNNNLSHLYRE